MTGGEADRRRQRMLTAVVVVGVLAVAAAVVGLGMSTRKPLYAIDEATYVDYLIKIDDGRLWMPRGDPYSQEAMRLVLCRGITDTVEERPLLVQPGDCSRHHRDPAGFLNAGVSTAAGHPPTYFLITAAAARAVRAAGVTGDLVTSGRAVGALWMAAGLLALVCLARELGAKPPAIALLVAAVALSEQFVEQWRYVTPDAVNLLVGSLVVLATVRWLRGTCAIWWLALAGLFAASIKSPNLLIVGACGLALLLATGTARTLRQRVLGAAALGGGALAATLIFMAVATVIATGGFDSPLDKAQYVPSLTLEHLTANLTAFLAPIGRESLGLQASQVILLFLASFLMVAALSPEKEDLRKPLAVSLLTGLIVGPSLLIVLVFLGQHQYFPIADRYGFNLYPGIFAIASSYWVGRVRLAAAALVIVPYCLLMLPAVF